MEGLASNNYNRRSLMVEAMIVWWFLFVSAIIHISHGNFTEFDCTTYTKLESLVHCGPKGYLLAFAHKNCVNFQNPDVRRRFNDEGRRFVDCVGKCLINDLTNYFEKSTPTCDEISDKSFTAHTRCYLECDFCKACKTNKYALMRSYYIQDFASFNALKSMTEVMSHCGLLSCLF